MNWAWAASLDQLWQSPAFPVVMTLAAGAFFALVLLVALLRAEKSIANGALAVITLLALAIAVAAGIRGFAGGERLIAQPVPAQGTVPLPALACLDGLAGESVEAACEKAVFASADFTAAAVSYTAMQISRLAAYGDVAAANAAMTPELATLRRVIERDRYGLVAQVLLTREQCSPAACDLYRSLTDRNQIAANMSERAYDGFVGRHAAAWGAPPQTAAAAPLAPSPAGLSATAPTGRPTNADFPTAASIPPVNIMGNEPPAAASPAPPQAATRAVAPPAPVQQAPAPRQAANPATPTTTAAAPPAPAAAKKQAAPKQQRTSAPVQLAPPVEPDDN
ncbi:MAG: hypothetical protein ACOY4O_08885 [Pseudomonadota bacterium]|jgi:hypothetical protein